MRIDILTAIPALVEGTLGLSVARRAKARIDVRVHDLRLHAPGRHRQIDGYPYGGGAGMVLKPEPIFACLDALDSEPDEVIFLSPDGELLTQQMANALSLTNHLVLIAGHYKGVDQRVRDALVTREVSIGDYVVSGGELPALVLLDAVARLTPGILGDATSALSDSFQDGLLGAPTYTRPAVYRGLEVPAVLRSGDHERIARWREEKRIGKTLKRRPDLLNKFQEVP